MTLDICEEKCQTKAVKEVLKSLPESQWYMIGVRSFNMHIFSLRIHFSDILNSEEKMKKKLMSVNAAHQQFNKVMLW